MLGIQYDITTQETRQTLKDKKQSAKNNWQYYL